MEFQCLTLENRSSYQARIAALEQTATYPLGDDFFKIDHGQDYFAFFDRLGDVCYYLATDEERVVAVGAAILRQVAFRQGQSKRFTWYLCDLKVHPDYQGRLLALRLLSHGIRENQQRCNQAYFISMNPEGQQPNRFVRMMERSSLAPFKRATQLGIYSLDADQMQAIAPLLRQHRGDIAYLSLQGKKDLRLQSNQELVPLVHVQWGEAIDRSNSTTPQPEHIHMFCVPQDDKLTQVLAQFKIFARATATVVTHGMNSSDWSFILTSDI